MSKEQKVNARIIRGLVHQVIRTRLRVLILCVTVRKKSA